MKHIKEIDKEVYDSIVKEAYKQHSKIQLIASENFVSRAVLEAQGCVMTNKYAEGYPGKRYYGGCEFVDIAESLAIERAKELFGCEHANVQPHSGSQANMAVYLSVLEPGDTILGMSLAHGGHLTHGSPVNFSGRLFNFVHYGVNKETETIDFDEVENLVKEHKPKMIVCGASAYPRVLDFKRFAEIAKISDAYVVADIAHIAGLVAAGIHPNPNEDLPFVTTTTHKTLRGPRGGMIMCREEFAKKVNKNIFPGIQGGPLMHVIAAKAISFKEAQTEEFKDYQKQIVKNASTLADKLTEHGFRLVSGGTDNHLMLIDLRSQDITGKDAETVLEKAGIIVNKNGIPFDDKPPMITSGVRIGTPSVTTRGMKEPEMEQIAGYIHDAISNKDDEKYIEGIAKEITELCNRFPLYEEMWSSEISN